LISNLSISKMDSFRKQITTLANNSENSKKLV